MSAPDPFNDSPSHGWEMGIGGAVSDVDLISAVARNSDRLQQSELVSRDSTDSRFRRTSIRSATVDRGRDRVGHL